MIRITEIKLPLGYDDERLKVSVCKELRVDGEAIDKIAVFRRAVDARRKSDVHFTVTADVWLNTDERRAVSRAKSKKVNLTGPYSYETA